MIIPEDFIPEVSSSTKKQQLALANLVSKQRRCAE
jgi:hypothetical protein